MSSAPPHPIGKTPLRPWVPGLIFVSQPSGRVHVGPHAGLIEPAPFTWPPAVYFTLRGTAPATGDWIRPDERIDADSMPNTARWVQLQRIYALDFKEAARVREAGGRVFKFGLANGLIDFEAEGGNQPSVVVHGAISTFLKPLPDEPLEIRSALKSSRRHHGEVIDRLLRHLTDGALNLVLLEGAIKARQLLQPDYLRQLEGDGRRILVGNALVRNCEAFEWQWKHIFEHGEKTKMVGQVVLDRLEVTADDAEAVRQPRIQCVQVPDLPLGVYLGAQDPPKSRTPIHTVSGQRRPLVLPGELHFKLLFFRHWTPPRRVRVERPPPPIPVKAILISVVGFSLALWALLSLAR